MKLIRLVSGIIWNSSLLNAVLSLLVLPTFLFLVKNSSIVLLILIFFLLICLYTVWVYKRRLVGYIYTLGYIISAALFMQVSAGNTIPTWSVISIVSILSLLSQEVLSDTQLLKRESLRQIVFSGIILSCFLFYSFIFGAIYVTILPVWLMFLLSFIFSTGLIWVGLSIYDISQGLYISILIAWLSSALYYILRFIPFTHTTQSALITIIVFYSFYIFQAVYYVTTPLAKHLISRLSLILLMVIFLFVSAQ